MTAIKKKKEITYEKIKIAMISFTFENHEIIQGLKERGTAIKY